MSTSPATAEQYLQIADGYLIDGCHSEALDAYASALVLSRDDTTTFRLHSHKAQCLLDVNQPALEDTSVAVHNIPTGLRPGETEAAWRRHGMAHVQVQNTAPAIEAFGRARQLAVLNQRPTDLYDARLRELQPKKPVAAAAPARVRVASASTAASTPTPVSTTTALPQAPKYQYYQSDKFMTVSILEPNVQEADLQVTWERDYLTVTLTKQGHAITVLDVPLYAEIDTAQSKITYKAEKVLVKLRKVEEGYEWDALVGKKKTKDKDATTTAPKQASSIPRPYASHKDWNSLEHELNKEEESETPEGDAAMNKLFTKLYANADDDTKRAMIKSYQTSGGTVLSTNWDEVSKKDYETERTAPKGMEWKSWEGDKLPQEED